MIFGVIHVNMGVISRESGVTSRAADIARQLDFPAVFSCVNIDIDFDTNKVKSGNITLHKCDILSVDDTTFKVYNNAIPLTKPKLNEQKEFISILQIS